MTVNKIIFAKLHDCVIIIPGQDKRGAFEVIKMETDPLLESEDHYPIPSQPRITVKQSELFHEYRDELQCSTCMKLFNHETALKRHVKNGCGADPRYECPYCNLRRKCSVSIISHVKAKHPDCESFYIDRRKVAPKTPTGVIRAGENWRFQCRYCLSTFTEKTELGQHVKDGCDDKYSRYRCAYCTFRSDKDTNVKLHMRQAHSNLIGCNETKEEGNA